MKKYLALLLAAMMLLSLAACGGGEAPAPEAEPAPQQTAQPEAAEPAPDPAPEPEPESEPEAEEPPAALPPELAGFLGTKTGKFYSQFSGGKMYMKYEMEMEGQQITTVTATNGEKTYSENLIGGVSTGCSVIDGTDMYTIDHASKMVIKMTLQTDTQTMAAALLEEEDVDMGDLKTGTREIDGKTYDTEEWIIDGAASIMCFDGDDLAYIVGAMEGFEATMKVLEFSDKVDESLFVIPADYMLLEM